MNLTITLGWWFIPILVAVAAYVGATLFGDKSDFDIPGFMIFIGGMGIAIGICIGHFVQNQQVTLSH